METHPFGARCPIFRRLIPDPKTPEPNHHDILYYSNGILDICVCPETRLDCIPKKHKTRLEEN